MKKIIIVLIISLALVTACATTNSNNTTGKNSLLTVFSGIGHLILSPFQIAAGLLEGIASMPYYLATNIHEINKGLVKAQAKITLDDTYESAYGKRLTKVQDNGDTGEVFRRMKHASQYFQKVLSDYGVSNPERYILTSIDTAKNQGYTLFAVVYRPVNSITVIDKYDRRTVRTFAKKDRLYYEPYWIDSDGNKLDTIIDWAGIPNEYYKTQKAQALLITMAANSVIDKKSSPEYPDIEKQWIAGEFKKIIEEKMNGVKKRMDI